MSSISCVLSITLVVVMFSKLRSWMADSSSSNMIRSAESSDAFLDNSSALPLPMKVALSIGRFLCVNFPTTTAPAVFASSANSSNESYSALSSSIPATMQRSCSFSELTVCDLSLLSASIISSSNALFGRFKGSMAAVSFTSLSPSSPLSPKNAAYSFVNLPSFTPSAAIASSMDDFNVPKSTCDKCPSPDGWVCMQRTPHSLSVFRTRRICGISTVLLSPIDTSAILPSRAIYTDISREMIPVNLARTDKSSTLANSSDVILISYIFSISSSTVSRMPCLLPFIMCSSAITAS